VVWGAGSTAEFIDRAAGGDPLSEREKLRQRIREAYKTVAAGRRVVVAEGTGQPGVGSVAGVSNGDVITLLKEMGVPVVTILVAQGGIGSTIDRVFPHLLSLNCMDCQVDGLIVNAVRLDKIGKVKGYLQRYYTEVFPALYCGFSKVSLPPPILGFIPEVPELGFPTMRLLAEAFADEHIDRIGFLNPARTIDYSGLFVRGVKVQSLESGFEPYLEDGDLVIVGINANEGIQALLMEDARQKREGRQGLSGLILSCSRTGGLTAETLEGILVCEVPTLIMPNDSADIVRRFSEMSVKIQPYDLAKKRYVDRTYQKYLDLSRALENSKH